MEVDGFRLKHSTPMIELEPSGRPVIDTLENANEGLPTMNDTVAVTEAVSWM